MTAEIFYRACRESEIERDCKEDCERDGKRCFDGDGNISQSLAIYFEISLAISRQLVSSRGISLAISLSLFLFVSLSLSLLLLTLRDDSLFFSLQSLSHTFDNLSLLSESLSQFLFVIISLWAILSPSRFLSLKGYFLFLFATALVLLTTCLFSRNLSRNLSLSLFLSVSFSLLFVFSLSESILLLSLQSLSHTLANLSLLSQSLS